MPGTTDSQKIARSVATEEPADVATNIAQLRPRGRLALADGLLIGLIALALAIYLPVVVHRVTAANRGDVQVFFRAGWAIWTGYPLYEVTDPHGWTYHYPPTFALLMGPFGLPLPGSPQPAWALPLWLSTAVWYAVCALALLASLHVWATALQRDSGVRAAPGSMHAWWTLRLLPLLILVIFAGDGLGRGQPTAIVLLTMVGFLSLYAGQRPYAAAFVLAVGITIKLFPAALGLIPLLRRDWRMLLSLALFCGLLMFAVPALCLGLPSTIELYRVLWADRLSGILGGNPTARVAAEISFLSYDAVSVGAMITRIAAGGVPGKTMPVPGWALIVQTLVNAAMVLALVLAGHGRFWRIRGPQPDAPYSILIAGALVAAGLPAMLSVAQPNYWAQALPLVAVVLVEHWRRAGRMAVPNSLIGFGILAWYGFIALENPGWHLMRVVGVTTPVFLALWVWGLLLLRASPHGDRFREKRAATTPNA